MLRGALRAIASTRPAGWAASLLESVQATDAPICAVLTYHRVLDPDSAPTVYPGHCVRPAELETQLRALVRRHEVISLADLLAARRGGARLPRRSLLLTFDDATVDFGENAWPILASLSLPAVLFVPTGFPDRPELAFWWERLYELLVFAEPHAAIDTPIGRLPVRTDAERLQAFRRLRSHLKAVDDPAVAALLSDLASTVGAPPARGQTLGWEELRRLSADGVTLAPHSTSHPLLPRLTEDQLRRELEEPRDELKRQIGAAPPAIAYPSGAHDARVRRAARTAGYEMAFTTRRGVNRVDRPNWLALHRINVGLGSSPRLIETQIGVLSALDRWR